LPKILQENIIKEYITEGYDINQEFDTKILSYSRNKYTNLYLRKNLNKKLEIVETKKIKI